MANPRVQIDIVAENARLKAKLAEAEALIAKSKSRIEEGGGTAESALKGATGAAKSFGAALRFIAWPAAILATATKITNWILDEIDHTRLYREEVEKLGQAYRDASKFTQIQAQSGPAAAARAQSLDEERKALEALQKTREDLAYKQSLLESGINATSIVPDPASLAEREILKNRLAQTKMDIAEVDKQKIGRAHV